MLTSDRDIIIKDASGHNEQLVEDTLTAATIDQYLWLQFILFPMPQSFLKSFSYRRLVNCPLTFCSAHCSQIALQDWVTDIWSLRDDGYLIIIYVASFSYHFFLNCEYDLVAHHRSCLCLRVRGRLRSGWRPGVFWAVGDMECGSIYHVVQHRR